MKLSRTVAYALQATVKLAELDSAEPVPCKCLATEGRLPERFLVQILRSLVGCGILKSTRGVQGGYRLARSPAEVSVLEVIEAIDGPMACTGPFEDVLSDSVRARLESALADAAELSRRQLASVTLAHLLPRKRGPQPSDGRTLAAR